MDLSLVLRLEEKVDQLLSRLVELEDENLRLSAQRDALVEEKQEFRAEVDRILAKLERVGREKS